MLLRTRLTLILSLLFLIVVGSLLFAGALRNRIETERLADVAVVSQRSLWTDLSRDRTAALLDEVDRLMPVLAQSGRPIGAPDLARTIERLSAESAPMEVQVQTPNGEIVFSSAPVIGTLPLLPAQSRATMADSAEPIAGLIQDRPDRFVFVAAAPILRNGSLAGFLLVTEDVAISLRRIAQQFEAEAFLINTRGRLVAGTNPALWNAASPELSSRFPELTVIDDGAHLLLTTSVPISDLHGSNAGALVTMRDSTGSLRSLSRIERLSQFAGIALIVIGLAAFYVYLRGAFRPVESSIASLEALARGDVDVSVEERGDRDVRRIAAAVNVFRANLIALRDQRARETRNRRRQERLIRRELAALADTLDEEGRAQIMADLERALAASTEDPLIAGVKRDAQLTALARLLNQMAARITEQHQRLNELIDELREALVTKTRLAALEQELEIARNLQLSLLPAPLPPEARFDLDAIMHAAKEVGGDFFDFFKLDDNRLGLVIGDVSGKGIPAALFMAVTRTHLRTAALQDDDPARAVAQTNSVLAEDNPQMMFVTLFYGVLDLTTGHLVYANAGHNPPYVLRRSGALEPLPRAGSPALGVVEDAPYQARHLTLEPGDVLFAYTDGVTEAFDIDSVAFGEARLEGILTATRSDEAVAGIDSRVLTALTQFSRGAEQSDDITCITVRFLEASRIEAGQARPRIRVQLVD